VAALAIAATAAAPVHSAGWPPFLAPPGEFSAEIVASVERVWAEPTLTRTVEGDAIDAPFDVYRVFVDAADVTAAAARHLGIARHEVRVREDGWYEADDHDGARGLYRVLVREPDRRVILSLGHHTSAFLGTIRGRALTVLTFDDRDDRVVPGLTAYVLIENRTAAVLARMLVRIFGFVADRKLTEGFRITARVVEWARREPAEFCAWLESRPVPAERVRLVVDALPACHGVLAGAAGCSYRRPRHSRPPRHRKRSADSTPMPTRRRSPTRRLDIRKGKLAKICARLGRDQGVT